MEIIIMLVILYALGNYFAQKKEEEEFKERYKKDKEREKSFREWQAKEQRYEQYKKSRWW